jgi:Flp pilus assembly protein TadB
MSAFTPKGVCGRLNFTLGLTMNPREIAGLILLAAAVVIAPFGYWLSFKWALVALAIGVPGVALYVTARVAKKLSRPEEISAPDVYPSKEMKVFHGADIFDGSDD